MHSHSNIYKRSLIYTQREFMGSGLLNKPFMPGNSSPKSSKFPASQLPRNQSNGQDQTCSLVCLHDSSLWRQENGGSRQHLTGRQKRRKKSKIMTPEKKMKGGSQRSVRERNSVRQCPTWKEGLKRRDGKSLPFQRLPVHTGPDTLSILP